MIPAPFAYAAPDSLEQAIALLAANKGAKVLAGGHNLLTEMKLRHVSPPLVVDLRKIQSLQGIRHGNAQGGVQIGALATLGQIAKSPEIQSSYQALVEAAVSAGDIQIRNAATLGGSLGYAELGADLVTALVALEATVHLTSSSGAKTVPFEEFLTQDAAQLYGAGQLITAIELPAAVSGMKSIYEKFEKFATAAAICGVAVKIVLAQDGTVSSCRIAATDGLTSAVRLHGVEAAITGQKVTKETVVAAVVHAVDNAASHTDRFASSEYRTHLTQVLTGRALMRAVGLQAEVWTLDVPKTAPSREAKARLVPVSGDGGLAPVDIYSGGARIGRDASLATIVINDRRVSRYHCRISDDGSGVFTIWDEGSTSGTYVNNEQVTMSGRTLQPGDLVNFGPLQYRFEPIGGNTPGYGDATEPFVRVPPERR